MEEKKKVYRVVKETREPVVIKIRKKDGSIVELKGVKITKKPQRVLFRRIKKEYYKPELKEEKKNDS